MEAPPLSPQKETGRRGGAGVERRALLLAGGRGEEETNSSRNYEYYLHVTDVNSRSES